MKRSGSRRDFLKQCAAGSAATMLATRAVWPRCEDHPARDWNALQEDPALKMIAGEPDLDSVLRLFPRTTGGPAFEPQAIAEGVQQLRTSPAVNRGHPLLDLSIKTGLAHIDATFRGDHPKYGVGTYEQVTFPPGKPAADYCLPCQLVAARAGRLLVKS